MTKTKTSIKYLALGNSHLKELNFNQAINHYQYAAKFLIAKAIKYWPQRKWPEKCFIVSRDYRFVYSPIPKVASTSFISLVMALHNIDEQQVLQEVGPYRIHYHITKKFSLSQYPHQEALRIINDPNYFKFVIVRNPWIRLASAYLNKFVQAEELQFFTQEVIDKVYQRQRRAPNYQQSITFRQFLNYLQVTEDRELDHHWLPQYLFLGSIKFDFVGKVESLDEDFNYLGKRLKINLSLPNNKNKTEYSKLNDLENYADYYPSQLKQAVILPQYQQMYTPELAEIVKFRYREDIETFGYKFSSDAKNNN